MSLALSLIILFSFDLVGIGEFNNQFFDYIIVLLFEH